MHLITVKLPCSQQDCLPLWFGTLGIPGNPWQGDPDKYSHHYGDGKYSLLHGIHPAHNCRGIVTLISSSFMKDLIVIILKPSALIQTNPSIYSNLINSSTD